MPDDEDRSGDAQPAFDESWADLVVPDDIAELEADIAAYRRELRQARRAQVAARLRRTRGTGPLFAVALASVLAGLVALMLTVMGPHSVVRPPAAAPLASTTIRDGAVGGLLPDALLTGPNGTIDSRAAALRPAVFALVPAGCACKSLLDGLGGAAYGEGLPVAVVVPASADPATASVVDSLDRGVSLYFDPTGALSRAVTGAIPTMANGAVATVVVVDTDGTIYGIDGQVTDAESSSLEAQLQSMLVRR
ncbi:MAG TPA: hypothetical protein VHB69_08170 [Mycobacteriales bacterium]|nr:hypothetical protein [Mycobacteriales bacterium]